MEVNSGRICASVVSMLSIRSTIMFLRVPDEVSLTYPSGTLESLSQVSLRICPSTLKVALCENAVETE